MPQTIKYITMEEPLEMEEVLIKERHTDKINCSQSHMRPRQQIAKEYKKSLI